jgi:hypothetical protein
MLTEEDKYMLVEILKKADIPVHIISCKLERCVYCEDNICTAEVEDVEIDEEGCCISFIPRW